MINREFRRQLQIEKIIEDFEPSFDKCRRLYELGVMSVTRSGGFVFKQHELTVLSDDDFEKVLHIIDPYITK